MTVYRHLAHAMRIIRAEPDIQKWGPLIDQLTQEQQDEVRPWLREYVKVHGLMSKPSPTPTLGAFSKTQRKR